MTIIRKKSQSVKEAVIAQENKEDDLDMQKELNLDTGEGGNGNLYRKNNEEEYKPKPRRKKIRVELIKEISSSDEEEDQTAPEADSGEEPIPGTERQGIVLSEDESEKPEEQPAVLEMEERAEPVLDAHASVRSVKRGHKGKRSEKSGEKEKLSINDLTRMSMPDLRSFAINLGISQESLLSMKKQEIIFSILKAHTAAGGIIHAYGSLEILPDGYGFLRSPQNSYLPGSDDIYISPSQIRLFNLRTGDTVSGQIRPPKDGERFFAMLRVETVNFDEPGVAQGYHQSKY